MLKEKIGMCIAVLGLCTADSELLIVPIGLMALGLWLMRELVEW